jgi:4-amino-4-deoxy-L-arabinose transferase-like glycosyltransferase
MSQRANVLIVVFVWAAVYLPSLGLFEIRGEEGRRILPAMAMLESGNFLVPQVGGEDYFRKPPLINWVVAGSLKLFGVRNEWTVRAPSVLSLLLVALAFVTVARRTLGASGSLVAALVWLSNVAILQKGRLIEIEALYASLTALAVVLWLSWWREGRSSWLTWIVPWIFLGLGWLAKGPTHLFFFYAVVIAALWQSRQWRLLYHPAHFIGLLVMLGIFGAWAIPLLRVSAGHGVVHRWSSQFTGRATGDFFTFGSWITILPRALAYLLPWILLVPLIRLQTFANEEDKRLARALLWSTFVPLTLVSLLPGSAPRYSIPAVAGFAWLIAMAYAQNALRLPVWLQSDQSKAFNWRIPVVVFVGLAVLAGVVVYPVAATVMRSHPKVRNIADQIERVIPPATELYAVDPNYQPFFFYLRGPVKYVSTIEELPWETRCFLVRKEDAPQARQEQKWSPRQTHELVTVKDYRNQTVVVFAVGPG